MLLPTVPEPLRELAQGNHPDEHEPDDEHPENDVLAFGGLIRESSGERDHRG